MRILADSNIQKSTVLGLRSDGHDVVWVMERSRDPGDSAVLDESVRARRILITVDKGFGRLVNLEGQPHHGLLLLDETPALSAQLAIVRRCLERQGADLDGGAFFRVTADGRVRRSKRR